MKLKPYLCFACFPKDEKRTDITIVMDRVPKWLMFLCWVFRKRESEKTDAAKGDYIGNNGSHVFDP